MKKTILFGLIIISIFLIGCAEKELSKPIDEAPEKITGMAVVCNKPYIQVGTVCCLDENDNAICDRDEIKEEIQPKKPVEKKEETKCGNNVCDEAETCESCKTDCGECFTISDLQADIGNVYFTGESEFLVLEKDKKINGAQFYVFKGDKSVRVGEIKGGWAIPGIVVQKEFVVVSLFEDEQDYIQTGDSFFKFIESNSEYLYEQIIERNKEALVNDIKEGNTFDRVKKRKTNVEAYLEHTTEENVLTDEFNLLETASNKIIERNYVSLEDYKVIYSLANSKLENEVDIEGVNYLQSASIFCTPAITITFYKENLPTHVDLDEINLINYAKNNRKELISDAQALVNMCEQRYEFDYWRGR